MSNAESGQGTELLETGDTDAGAGGPLGRLVRIEPLSFGHLVQLAVAVAVVTSAVHVTSVAQGNVSLAAAILGDSGYLAPLTYMALTLFPLALMLSAAYLLRYRWAAAEADQHDRVSRNSWLMVVWILLLLSILAPWIDAVGSVVLILGVWAVDSSLRRKARDTGEPVSASEYMRISRREIFGTAVFLIAVNALPQIISPTAWVPEEAIVTKSEVIRGYVLKVGDPWATVLVTHPRYLRYVRINDIQRREVCPSDSMRTLVEIVTRSHASPPNCPAATPSAGAQ